MSIIWSCMQKVKDWISTLRPQRGHTMPCLFIVVLCVLILSVVLHSFDSEFDSEESLCIWFDVDKLQCDWQLGAAEPGHSSPESKPPAVLPPPDALLLTWQRKTQQQFTAEQDTENEFARFTVTHFLLNMMRLTCEKHLLILWNLHWEQPVPSPPGHSWAVGGAYRTTSSMAMSSLRRMPSGWTGSP